MQTLVPFVVKIETSILDKANKTAIYFLSLFQIILQLILQLPRSFS